MTILLLDIDGVINTTNPRWGSPPYWAYVPSITSGRQFRFRWSPLLLNRIAKLVTDHGVELRWSTTWVDDIDAVKAALRFHHGDPAFTLKGCSFAWDLKVQAYKDALGTGRRIIWIDDDIPQEMVDAADPDKALLIAPTHNRGLTRVQMEIVEKWVENG